MGSELLILANWWACTVGGWICLCRMAKMSHSETKLEIRLQYMIWFSLFAGSGWSFLFGERASPIQLLMSLAILVYLFLGISVWNHRAPPYTRRESA